MNKKVFLSFVMTSLVLPGALAFGQAEQGQPDQAPACVPVAAPGLIGVEVNEVVPWIEAYLANLVAPTQDRKASAAIADLAFVSGSLNGRFGTSAYEGLQALSNYIHIIDLRIVDSASVNGVPVDQATMQQLKGTRDSLNKTRERINGVIGALDKYRDQKQKLPGKHDDKSIQDYDNKIDKAAGAALDVLAKNFDTSHQKAGYLTDALNNVMKLEKPQQ